MTLLKKGAKWLLSALGNSLAGDGYPANAAKFIHFGHSDQPESDDDWHLIDYVGSLGQVTNVVIVNDNLVRFELQYTTGADPVYITEMALAVTANDPTSPTDYSNAVLDRVVHSSTQIIPPNTTRTIQYFAKIGTS
jgi:hypothetical protein